MGGENIDGNNIVIRRGKARHGLEDLIVNFMDSRVVHMTVY